jgi:sortase B
MKKRSGLEWCTSAVRIADCILNRIVALILILALFYSGYVLWDTWSIYEDAGIDSDLMKYKPQISEEDASNPTLSDMLEINPDVCAWLTVDGTNIDYPVVKSQDNLEYINKDVYGEFSMSGSIFLDCRNQRDFSDYYSLIYGHHMAGEVMFGQVPYFLEDDYFQEHATGTLFLPEHTYKIQWFACVQTDAYDEYVYSPIAADNENSEAYMENLLTYIQQTARQYRDIGVTTSDHLIALSTCSEVATNGRTLLIGRLVL